MMDDGNIGLYYDSGSAADAGAGGYIPEADDTLDAVDGTGDPDVSDILPDVSDGSSSTVAGEGEDAAGDSPPGTGEGGGSEVTEVGGAQSGEDGTQEGVEDIGTDMAEGEVEGEADAQEALLFDTQVLDEIRDILREHTDSTDSFMSGLTVSGNVIEVSLDPGSSALITDVSEKQAEMMVSLDGMSGLISLVLFVLLFDLLHRFAKRIIKNLTGGDKNGANP